MIFPGASPAARFTLALVASVALGVAACILTGCAVRMPLGEGGRYGALVVGYELPEELVRPPASGGASPGKAYLVPLLQ